MAISDDGPRGILLPQVKALYEPLLAARQPNRVIDATAMQSLDAVTAVVFNMDAPPQPAPVEMQIPSPSVANATASIRALVFTPEHSAADSLPVLLYLHGGGFVVWSPETHAKLCKLIAVGSGVIVVSIDYRRTPEHPYPAPLDDAVTAFRWLRANAASLGGDAARIAIGGDSAGGNLSAALPLRMLAEGEAPPEAVVLLCPWTDMHHATESFRLFGPDDPILDDLTMTFFRVNYAPDPALWEDSFVSPLLGDLAAFPPTCMIAGGIDPLRDDGVLFADKLRAAKREVEAHVYGGMPHDFMVFVPQLDATRPAIDRVSAFLRRTLAAPA